MHSITAFAPATVANVACGFDVLGFAITGAGDEVTVRFGASGVAIEDISGDDGRLPRDPQRNTAGAAAQAVLDHLGESRGVVVSIRKGLPLASGLGGSAASAAAAVVAVDALLGARLPIDELVGCALEGEGLGVRSTHIDNVAAATCGGLVLARHWNPADIVRLPTPPGLTSVVVHPQLEIETSQARALIGDTVLLKDAIREWANLGAFVDALHRGDYQLMARALEDSIAEPRRAKLLPGLDVIKRAALDAGAIGCSFSGSGPSMFALCRDPDSARHVAASMTTVVEQVTRTSARTFVSPVPSPGARLVTPCVS